MEFILLTLQVCSLFLITIVLGVELVRKLDKRIEERIEEKLDEKIDEKLKKYVDQ